jgi:CHASE2 domain-containing sensor protein
MNWKAWKQSWSCWLIDILVIFAISFAADIWKSSFHRPTDFLYHKFSKLVRFGAPPYSKFVTIVEIGDDEFWGSGLDNSIPLNGGYLARLISAISSSNPQLLAIDLNFLPRSAKVYQDEFANLENAVKSAADRHKVVLPLYLLDHRGGVQSVSGDIFRNSQLHTKNVSRGFINVPDDVRKLPLELASTVGQKIEPLSIAIVRASIYYDEKLIPPLKRYPYVGFIDYSGFSAHRVSAGDILRADSDALAKLAHRIVILGGTWHSAGYKQGVVNDTFLTPGGEMSGVMLQANYVEAIIDQRVYPSTGSLYLVLEVAAGLWFIFILKQGVEPRWKLMKTASAMLILMLVGYVIWLQFGLYTEFLYPVVAAILLHWLIHPHLSSLGVCRE